MKKLIAATLLLVAHKCEAQIFSGPSPIETPKSSIIFMATADKVITNTVTETTAFTDPISIPANFLEPKTNIRINGGGLYSVPLLTIGNLTIKTKIGGQTIASSVISTLVGAVTDGGFDFECVLVVRSVGVSGSIISLKGINFSTTAGGRLFADLVSTSPITVDTTQSLAVDVTLQWQVASLSRSITVKGADIEIDKT